MSVSVYRQNTNTFGFFLFFVSFKMVLVSLSSCSCDLHYYEREIRERKQRTELALYTIRLKCGSSWVEERHSGAAYINHTACWSCGNRFQLPCKCTIQKFKSLGFRFFFFFRAWGKMCYAWFGKSEHGPTSDWIKMLNVFTQL